MTWNNSIDSILTADVSNNNGDTIYREDHYAGSPVALFPYGNRMSVAFLGNDWAYSGPNGTWDGNWREVLRRAVAQVSSAAGAAAIQVSGNAVTITDGDSTPVSQDWTDFGSVAAGSAVSHSFTVHNSGNAALATDASTTTVKTGVLRRSIP